MMYYYRNVNGDECQKDECMYIFMSKIKIINSFMGYIEEYIYLIMMN